jgi:hypothetical protein
MPWWAWIILGAVLLGAEVVIAADFYLVFFGIGGLIVGLMLLAGVALPAWLQWLAFAAFAIVLLLLYRRRLKAILTRPDRQLEEDIVGEIGTVGLAIPAGSDGRIELRGTQWSARNVGEEGLSVGDRVRVVRKDGLFLHIRREN